MSPAGPTSPSAAGRWRRWCGSHPTVCDAALGVAVFLFAVVLPRPESVRPLMAPLTTTSVVLAAVSCALLTLRRRFPWRVWTAVTLLALVSAIDIGGPSEVNIPAVVALYTVSTRVSTPLAVGAAAVTALTPALVALFGGSAGLVDTLIAGYTAWSGLAAVTGIAVRNQRAVVAAAQQRALEAERTREDEAQRRVAEERLRIARDLHDVVAHHVSVINVQAGVAGHLLRSDPDRAAEAMGHVREASQVVLREVPGLLGLLRTDEDGVETAPTPGLGELGRLVENARRTNLQVTWRSSGTPVPLAPGVDVTAYRILQEALTNASRYGAGSAELSVAYDDDGCTLEVRNRIAELPVASTSSGHGIVGMTERALAVGGVLEAGPSGTDEWLVRVRLDGQPGRAPAPAVRP